VRSLPSNGRRRPGSKTAARTLALAVAGTLLAGCGGSSERSGAGGGEEAATTVPTVPALPADQPQRPACGLVTQAEVEAAIAARVNAGRQESRPSGSGCTFPLVGGPDQTVAVISISSSGVPAAFEAARRSVQGAQPVNAGEQAFVAGGQAAVRKGDTMVIVLVALRQQPPQLAAAAAKLAQSVASDL